jgi:c(7)-type cytochrome triheme protein
MLKRIRHYIASKSSRFFLGWAMLLLGGFVLAGAALAAPAKAPAKAATGTHVPLAQDGVHDPANPGLKFLQEPGEALSKLPPDVVGNNVRWVKALEEGVISPRTNIMPETKIKVLDQDVIMPRTGEMPMVRFPHKQHTEWLDCSNCHEKLFKSKAGATKAMNMFQILQGEYCGLCHGAVSFPLTECKRCHSVPRK